MSSSLSDQLKSIVDNFTDYINEINEHLNGPNLYVHISNTLDAPPSIVGVNYFNDQPRDYKEITLALKWKNFNLRKHIRLYSCVDSIGSEPSHTLDSMYNQYVPYHDRICIQGNDGQFSQIVARKAYTLSLPWVQS